MLDLQVWFNLAWCGYTADRLYPELPRLRAKGRDFTEEEKQRVLDIHLEILRIVLERYARGGGAGPGGADDDAVFSPDPAAGLRFRVCRALPAGAEVSRSASTGRRMRRRNSRWPWSSTSGCSAKSRAGCGRARGRSRRN